MAGAGEESQTYRDLVTLVGGARTGDVFEGNLES
jgi:hypothetical protein